MIAMVAQGIYLKPLSDWAKAAVDRRETRRGLTAAKNSRDNFSLRPSVVQQPETFAKNYNFANASLLRNLIFRCSFHLNEPPPWKLAQHEILIEVLVDEGSARVVVESSRIIPLMSTTPTRYWGLLVISAPTKLLLWWKETLLLWWKEMLLL